MGAPKPDRGPGRPIDYFRAKVGDDGSHAAAAKKFHAVYGEKPRAIDILLPPEITTALHVEHIAWGSGGMKARGHTNFATVGTLGGPDTLTVWNEDGTVDEIEITDVDDPAAKALEVSLYTTFQFYIPDVLGAASLCAITSKGQKTTDNLFAKLVELYGYFGSRVTFIVKPKLVLRPATGRPTVIDKETKKPKRIKSSFYALDLYVPESFDEMFGRLAARNELLQGHGGPVAQLYGTTVERTALERSTVADPDVEEYEAVEGEIVDEPEDSSGKGADSHAAEEAPRSPTPQAGGPDDQDPGLAAPSPDPAPHSPQQAADGGPEASANPEGDSGGSSTGNTLETDGAPAVAPGAAFPVPAAVIDKAGNTIVQDEWTVAGVCADVKGREWVTWLLSDAYDGTVSDDVAAAVRLYVTHKHPELVGSGS